MAFAARLGALTGELVEAITLRSAETNLERFKAQREATLRTLRPNQYLRTNQFEVEHQLDGLEERFRVNGREALADALHERRETLLETPSNFHPEILFLLLELSDQPTYYSKLSDLDLLKTGEDDAGLQLRWEDIAKEDGWEKDAAIWKSIKYSDSSDDEIYDDDSKSESEVSTDPSEVQILGRTAEDLIIHSEDIVQLNQIRDAQEWRHEKPTDSHGHARKVPVTEFHITREVLFMLQGLDTTLFGENGTANPAFQMAHLVWDTHRALISYFSEAGRQLAVLRSFIERPQRASHLQVFQDTVAMRLRDLDKRLTSIEAKLVAPKEDVIVSLLAIKRDLVSDLEPLYSLSSIIAQIQDVPNLGTFRYLELLFDEASMAQLSGKLDIYEFLARIFVECFNVYLRPIRLWMEEGKLIPGDKIFFVSEAPSQVSPSKIWREQFRLRRSADRKLHAPKFLQPAAAKIFNAGKNIVILKRLGRWVSTSSEWTVQEPPLDYETLCPKGLDLAPFSELFDAAFDGWIQTKYNTTSTTLRNALFEECGLWSALDAMEHLYFMSDGSATEHWTSHLFDKLDTLNTGWHNRYSLTSVAQEAFTSLVDMTRVSVNVAPGGLRIPVLSARDSVKAALPTIRVNYRLAWPIRMILTEDSNSHYDAIFALLLQLKRALYVLHKRKLLECYWTDGENWDEEAFYYSLRNNLLWFCTTLQTYLVTLVLAPNCAKMRQEMRGAHDVDAMIAVHAAFMKQVVDEACLGSRLTPIRECFLDILDLAIKLEQAQTANAAKEAQRMQHVSRLSARDLSPTPGTPGLKSRYVDSSDSDMDEPRGRPRRGKPFMAALKEIKADFDRHLRFVCGGLRSVARATSDVQSAKWDILAEMLQTGCREEKMGFSSRLLPLLPSLPHTLHFPSPPESTTTFLILFHGLGDHDVPFASFARNLNLPGVLAISVRGTEVLPPALLGSERPGFHWGDDLAVDPGTGELADDPGFERARRAIMDKLVGEVLIEKCGWEMSDIIFFGFGQGGSLALGLASSLRQPARVTDITEGEKKGSHFKGVVSIGGPLPQSMVPTISSREKSRTSVLVCQLEEDAVDAVKREFEDVRVVQWKRREVAMPSNREEVLPLMQFFADRLRSGGW